MGLYPRECLGVRGALVSVIEPVGEFANLFIQFDNCSIEPRDYPARIFCAA